MKTARAWLKKSIAENGDDVTVAALDRFRNRADGFHGIKSAWALFVTEADTYLAVVQQEKAAAARLAQNQKRGGDELKAKVLAEFEALQPPPTEAERAQIQKAIATGEAMLTKGPEDYFCYWQGVDYSAFGLLANIRVQRHQQEQGGSLEDYLAGQ